MNQSLPRACLLAGGLLMAFTCSAQSYVHTFLDKIGYVADVRAAPNPSGEVLHSFQKRISEGSWVPLVQINAYGSVGIGNLSSAQIRSLLNVGAGMGSLAVDVLNGGACLGFNAMRQPNSQFYFGTNGTYNGGSLIWADPQGSLHFSTRGSGSNNAGLGLSSQERWLPANWAADDRRLTIGPTGQVKIGRGQPLGTAHADYKLAVDGKLVAQAVHVTLANWADFVFEPEHTMLSLPALKQYVQAHHHLPAIPSAADVARDGVSLGDMDARLLQTLEELTLHVIALDERNAQLQAQLNRLAAQLPPVPTVPAALPTPAVPAPAGR